jgi:PAS domain S-box-containing protein
MSFENHPTEDRQATFAMSDRLQNPPPESEESGVLTGYSSADLAQLALDQVPCAVLLLDGAANVLQANTTLKRWMGSGMLDTISESDIKAALGLDRPAEQDAVLLAVESVQQDLLPPAFELKLTRGDGSHMALLAGASAVRSPTGEFLACALALTDITERARQMGELLVSTERMRSITDRTTARQAYFDADLTCRFVNRALCTHVGARREILLGRSFEDCFDSDEVREMLPRVMPALSGDKQTFLIEKQVLDGSTQYLECRVLPDGSSEDGVRGVFIEIEDVTERRRTEDLVLHANMELEARVARRTAELTRTKRRYSLMAEALQDSCIFFLDATGRITEWSESAHRLHGFTSENVLGKHYGAMTATMKGEQDEITAEDSIRLATQRGQWESRGWRLRADGQHFWAHTLITALRGDNDELEGLSCITRDMTAAKDLDKVMNDLNGELERRVSERVRQYVVPNRDLDVFTHHITHDLRGPLRHINTYAGLMLEGLEGAMVEGVEIYRDGLRTASKRLNGMVEALLTYARIGRVDLHPAPMPLGTLVEGLIAGVMQKYPDVQINWTVHDDLPVVVGDTMLVTELLSHVLDNAAKFSRTRPKPEVQIGWSQENENWGQFFVVDNGEGFDVSKANNLFVMFARQHHSLDFPGAGTGLALAQRIVQRHGGKIWADSTPDHGCALYFTLPVDMTVSPCKLADLHF